MMSLKVTIATFQFSATFLCLAILLFATELARMPSGYASAIARQITAVCRDASTQWMLVVCGLIYWGVFLFWESGEKKPLQGKIVPLESGETSSLLSGWSRHAAAILLITLVVLSLVGYAGNYPSSAKSLQILTLLAGIVIGKAFAAWVNFSSSGDDLAGNRTTRRRVAVFAMIVGLLSIAALYQPNSGPAYAYHDIRRWTGPWDNPNLFGLLMGTGAVLVAGLGLGRWRMEDGRSHMANKHWTRKFWKCLFMLLCLIAAILLGRGLYHSFSRGAWLGTAVGLGYLIFNYICFPMNPKMAGRAPHPQDLFSAPQPSSGLRPPSPAPASEGLGPLPIGSADSADAEREKRSLRNDVGTRRVVQRGKTWSFGRRRAISCVSWLNQNRLPWVTIALSVFVVGFWQLRFSKFQLAQRIASVANPNDFSWRNRISAWQGATRMMMDKPLTGFGWGEAESVYAKRFCTTSSNESAAIEMNDYLMLGISGGVPVMLCFIGYVALALTGKSERWITQKLGTDEAHSKPRSNRGDDAQTSGICENMEPPNVGCYSLKGISCESHASVSPSSILYLPSSVYLTTTCRAGAIVLLVGFWFDGGLFKLPAAVVFWTLLELSRLGFVVPQTASAKVANERLRAHHDGAHGVTRPTFGNCHHRWLSRAAWCAVMVAVGVTSFYLFAPYLPVSDKTIAIARHYLILSKERDDFDFLADKPIWHGQKLKTLLDQAELAHYNRALINWKLDEKIYRNYVLSPIIEPALNTNFPSLNLNWRRSLWEAFYPLIRHENSLADAAQIVVRHLRERVTIADLPNPSRSVSAIWRRQVTDENGFQILYVAALRSVGVPARLDTDGQAEFYDGQHWQPAPKPVVD